MVKIAANRSLVTKVVCILSMALVCALGVVQALHVHPENSTTSHHACSICLTSHAGMSVEAGLVIPVMVAAVLTDPAPEREGIFRPASTPFIRPPPGF